MDELIRDLTKVVPMPKSEARRRIKALVDQEVIKACIRPRSDLAWCLGKLRGLGHPAEHLEKQYKLNTENRSIK